MESEKTETYGEMKMRRNKVRLAEKKERDRARTAGFFFSRKIPNMNKNPISAKMLVRGRVALWLNRMSAKTQQGLASETQEERAVRLETMSSQEKNKKTTCLPHKPSYRRELPDWKSEHSEKQCPRWPYSVIQLQ